VCDNLGFRGVACIQITRNTECLPFNKGIATKNAENGGGFAGEHGADYDFETHGI
jgi:hypothetical protein